MEVLHAVLHRALVGPGFIVAALHQGLAAGVHAQRDALEATKEVVGTHGTFNMSAADHNGLDQRARVMVRIEKGAWVLQK